MSETTLINKIFLVTGTNTDVGKTKVASSILAESAFADHNVYCYKPIQTGGQNFSKDLTRQFRYAAYTLRDRGVMEKAFNRRTTNWCVSYLLKEPCSPHHAAKVANIDISFDKIINDFSNLVTNGLFPEPVSDSEVYRLEPYKREEPHPDFVPSNILIVELAGGTFSPVNTFTTNADLINEFKQICLQKNIDFKVVLVTNEAVGSISATLSNLAYLKYTDYLVVNQFIAGKDTKSPTGCGITYDYFNNIKNYLSNKSTLEGLKFSECKLKVDKSFLSELNLNNTVIIKYSGVFDDKDRKYFNN